MCTYTYKYTRAYIHIYIYIQYICIYTCVYYVYIRMYAYLSFTFVSLSLSTKAKLSKTRRKTQRNKAEAERRRTEELQELGPEVSVFKMVWGSVPDPSDGTFLNPTWMLFGDLVSGLSNGPYAAYYGSLWGLIGDTKWTY